MAIRTTKSGKKVAEWPENDRPSAPFPPKVQNLTRPCSKCGTVFKPTVSQWATYNWMCPECRREYRRERRRLRREGGSR